MQFKDVMVDDSLKQRLITSVKENRISHAQLFLSQPGSHSFALAIAYAQYVCCENRSEEDSCGVCPSCLKISKLAHPDLHIYFPNCTTNSVKKDPESSMFMDDFRKFVFQNNFHLNLNDWLLELGGENKQATINIRDCSTIIAQNGVKSYEGGYKIFILWMAERFYHDAAPKLLKTLEEPENKTLFILISENSDKILNTILSRTQLVKIPKISNARIKDQLIKDFEIDKEKATDIAAVADGNYNKAILLASDDSQYHQNLEDINLILKSVLALSRTNIDRTQVAFLDVQECFEKIIKNGREYQKSFLSNFIRILRNLVIIKCQNDALCKVTRQERALINNYAGAFNLKNTSQIFDECNRCLYHIERNGNSKLIFLDWYLKMAQLLRVE